VWTSIAIACLILIVLIVLTTIRSRQREKTWKKWAASHGLNYQTTAQGPLIVGSIDRHPIEISTDQLGSDNEGGVAVVRFVMGLNRIPENLQVVGVPGFVGDLVQWKEGSVELGDEKFDREILIKGPPIQQSLEYWTPERRRALLDLVHHSEYDHVSLENSELTVEFRSITPSDTELEEALRNLQDAVSILEDSP